jgi:catechol-2,3-dioxygenase
MQIRKLILETKDVSSLTAFYRDVLELPVIHTADQLIITFGATTIQFRQTASKQEPFYHFAINIPSNKIAEAKAWLERRVDLLWMEDYNSVVADFVNWNAKSLYFFDKAGNIVELIARFDLNMEREAPFSSEQFLSISEIGLVIPEKEIETVTSKLLQQYSLNFFRKQPPFPNFKAVGDDEGLFIIVTEHRHWYPAHRASGIFPIDVEFVVDDNLYKVGF